MPPLRLTIPPRVVVGYVLESSKSSPCLVLMTVKPSSPSERRGLSTAILLDLRELVKQNLQDIAGCPEAGVTVPGIDPGDLAIPDPTRVAPVPDLKLPFAFRERGFELRCPLNTDVGKEVGWLALDPRTSWSKSSINWMIACSCMWHVWLSINGAGVRCGHHGNPLWPEHGRPQHVGQ